MRRGRARRDVVPCPAALGSLARLPGGSRLRREPEDPVMPLRHRHEVVARAGGRLRGAKHKIAVGGEPLGKSR